MQKSASEPNDSGAHDPAHRGWVKVVGNPASPWVMLVRKPLPAWVMVVGNDTRRQTSRIALRFPTEGPSHLGGIREVHGHIGGPPFEHRTHGNGVTGELTAGFGPL